MIHEVGRELEAKLTAKGCAFKVVDREEFKRIAWASNRIVIDETGDTYSPAKSQSYNPKRYYTGNIGAKLTIYAKSAKSGAAEFEHRRLARKVVDLSLVALRTIRAERRMGLAIGGGRFVEIEDLAASERKGGAVYELDFTLERGIADIDFAGEAAEEFTIAAPITMAGAPALTFANEGVTGDTITRSAGSWIADGFVAGVIARVRGSASNNVDGEVASVTASVLTLGSTLLTNEGPVSGCIVSAGGITNTTEVSQDDGNPEVITGA